MLRRRWLVELWRNFLVASGSGEIWESNGSILILAIPVNERSIVSTEFYSMCGRRPVIGMGAMIGDDKQKANQALAVQLRQLRFDGVDPIQELRLYIPWLGRSSFTASMKFSRVYGSHRPRRCEGRERTAICPLPRHCSQRLKLSSGDWWRSRVHSDRRDRLVDSSCIWAARRNISSCDAWRRRFTHKSQPLRYFHLAHSKQSPRPRELDRETCWLVVAHRQFVQAWRIRRMVLTVGGGRDRPSDRSHEASAAVPSDEDMVSPHASDYEGAQNHGQQSRDEMQHEERFHGTKE